MPENLLQSRLIEVDIQDDTQWPADLGSTLEKRIICSNYVASYHYRCLLGLQVSLKISSLPNMSFMTPRSC